MAISGIINLFVSKMLYKVAKEEDSVAIEADALHLKTDVYSSIGVALGLTIIYFTGWTFLDPFIAIAIAIYIAIEAYHLLIKAFSPLTDVSIEQNKLNDIINIIINNHNVCSIPHSIRSRKSGNKQFIDLHLEFNPAMTIYDVHKICDQIEDNINFDYPNTEIIIHPEVCDGNCDNCHYKKQMKNGNT